MDKNRHDIEYQAGNSTLVGTRRRELIDASTGEVMEVEQTTRLVYGSRHFWKCYLKDFLAVMKSLSSKQYTVFIHIVENTKASSNKFIGTYDKIVKGTGCCRQTVAKTMKILQDCDFIRKIQNGVWMINPHILVKGNDNKQMSLSKEYDEAIPKEKTEKEEVIDRASEQNQHEEVCENSDEQPYKDIEGWDYELEIDFDSDLK